MQKDTEQRLTRKYIDGLESERERMASELHDDVCNSMLALELEFRDMPSDISKELKPHLEVLSGLRERLRTLSHELMPPVFQYATIDEMLADYIFHLACQMDSRLPIIPRKEWIGAWYRRILALNFIG